MAEAPNAVTLGGGRCSWPQLPGQADVRRALTAHGARGRRAQRGEWKTSSWSELQTGGVPLASKMAEILRQIEGEAVGRLAVGSLDVAFYRDDIGLRPVLPEGRHRHPGRPWPGRWSILVDDVLFLQEPHHPRRPQRPQRLRPGQVHSARRHGRPGPPAELPIRPDYVGKNLPAPAKRWSTSVRTASWIGSLEDRSDRHPASPLSR